MKKLTLTILSLIATAAAATGANTFIKGELSNSRIYPGTTHSYEVAVPDAYDGHTPACLYIGLDGQLCDAANVMESLYKSGEMPLTIGVFLQPGVIRAADGEVLRYNRSNEFDSTDPRFAEFIETELLPAVKALRTDDGREIVLSECAADRMIFGLSSGGIAAFTAAWHRPDLFSKVFSGCGTFVPMRGGNDLQAIVRKSEPKPLRICLQDGYDDAWNPLFGSWFEANAMLGTALEFAGYDVMLDWGEGVHSVKRAAEIFPNVMRWMWRDHPADISIRPTSNNYLKPLLVDGAVWQAVGTPSDAAEMTLRSAVYPDGRHAVSVAEGSNSLIQSIITADGEAVYTQPFYWLHNFDNCLLAVGGIAFDGDGYLWTVTDAGIQICDQNGRVRGIIELPRGITAGRTAIRIDDGRVTVVELGKEPRAYSRRFNVKAAQPGVRPPSQGQA